MGVERGNIMKIFNFYILMIVMFLMICGCSGKSPQILKDNHDKIQVKTIAVLPIENTSFNGKTSHFFRSRLLEELYFKGYSKMQLEIIDKKLETLYIASGDKKSLSTVTPQMLKDLIGADAGMYCTLTQDDKSKIIYAPIKISARCELRSAETGEVLWSARSESTERRFDFTNKGLEKKSHEYLENVIDEVVNQILKTLPDGPNLRG
jgi:hypothetical protein